MQFLDSFSAIKLKSAYFVRVDNLRKDGRLLYFQFDTGASVTLIGLNTICDRDSDKQSRLKEILLEEISRGEIKPLPDMPKTVTNETVEIYPCKMRDVSIMQTAPMTFLFHIYLGEINMPLLGFDHTDGFTYHHMADGNIEVTSIPAISGDKYYPNNLIDFDKVMRELYNE